MWIDRLRDAAYVSPGGVRTEFSDENVSLTQTKRTSGYEFPGVDGTYVQDLGAGGRKIPLRIFLWGEDYDLRAERFFSSLLERGVGRLEHPLYGVVDVVPYGSLKRRDELKTAANQAVIEVTFWETRGTAYPEDSSDPKYDAGQAIRRFNTAAAEEFSESSVVATAVDRATFKGQYLEVLGEVSTALDGVASIEQDLYAEFRAGYDSLSLGLDVLVGDPLTLAFQTLLYVQAPARSAAAVSDRLAAYGGLVKGIVSSSPLTVQAYRTKDLAALGYVSAAVITLLDSEFSSRSEALDSAEAMLSMFDSVVAWREAAAEAVEQVDTGAAYQALQESVALASAYIIEAAFSLRQERSLVTTRARTVLDLAAELYGDLDDAVDLLITTNHLSGAEILEIPRGRTIVYYV